MKVSVQHTERRTRQLVQLVIRRTPLEGSPTDSSVELQPTQSFEFLLGRIERAEIALAGSNHKHGAVPVRITLEATEPGELITRDCMTYGFAQPGEIPWQVVRGSGVQRAPVAPCAQATVELTLAAREACCVMINNFEESAKG
jgi:hypothetical protein